MMLAMMARREICSYKFTTHYSRLTAHFSLPFFYCCCCYNWPLTILINFSNSHCSLHTSHLSLLISHVFFPNYLLFFSSAPKTCACLLTSRPKCTSVFPLTSFNLLTDQIRELCCFYLFFSLFVVVFVCPVFSSPSAPNSLLGNVR